MQSRAIVMFFLAILGSLVFAVGCSSQTRSSADRYDAAAKRSRDAVAAKVAFAARPKEGTSSKTALTSADGISREWREETYERADELEQYIFADQYERILFPGSLLWSRSLGGGSPTSLPPIPRRQIPRIVLTGISAPPVTLQDATFGAYQAALRETLAKSNGSAFKLAISRSDASTLEEALLDLKMSASYWGVQLGASLHRGRTANRSFVMIAVDQEFFSTGLDMSAMTSDQLFPRSVFKSEPLGSRITSVAESDLGGEVAYVDRVTYGRRILFTLTSEATQDTLNRALSLSTSMGTTVVGMELGEQERRALQTLEIRGVVIGGRFDAAAFDAVLGSRDNFIPALNTFLSNTGAWTTDTVGIPTGFTVRYASDNAVVAYFDAVTFVRATQLAQFCTPGPRDASFDGLVTTGSEHARLMHSDGEMHSDDWTGTRVQYRLSIAPDGQSVQLWIFWKASELESNQRYRGKTVIGSERTIEVWRIPGCGGNPGDVIIDRIEGISLSAGDDPEHMHRGECHGYEPHPEIGGLYDIRLRFDGPGGDDTRVQSMQARLRPFRVYLKRRGN